MTDHNPIYDATAGNFATARRGCVEPQDIAFIQSKAAEGVSLANISRMVWRSSEDVRPWMLADPPVREMARIPIRPPKKYVLSLWRGLIEVPPVPQAQTEGPPTMRAVAEGVCWRHGVTMDAMVGPRRQKSIAFARQHAMHDMVLLQRWSLPQIGRFFHRDHTTVLHGYRRHAQRLAKGEATA